MHKNRGTVAGTAIAGIGMTAVLALLAFGTEGGQGARADWWLVVVVAAAGVLAVVIALAPNPRTTSTDDETAGEVTWFEPTPRAITSGGERDRALTWVDAA